MDKIHYLPTEGATGFWGLRGVRMKPRECPGRGFCSCDDPPVKRCEVLAWEDEMESCKSNKLEIVNQEVIPNVPLWPGDIFDLPIGYQFKEEWHDPCIKAKDCLKPEDGWKCMFVCKIGSTKVLRLVKTETKVSIPPPLSMSEILPHAQPEPEESQNEKEWERFWYKFGENDFDMRNAHKYYTIQRKKQ